MRLVIEAEGGDWIAFDDFNGQRVFVLHMDGKGYVFLASGPIFRDLGFWLYNSHVHANHGKRDVVGTYDTSLRVVRVCGQTFFKVKDIGKGEAMLLTSRDQTLQIAWAFIHATFPSTPQDFVQPG